MPKGAQRSADRKLPQFEALIERYGGCCAGSKFRKSTSLVCILRILRCDWFAKPYQKAVVTPCSQVIAQRFGLVVQAITRGGFLRSFLDGRELDLPRVAEDIRMITAGTASLMCRCSSNGPGKSSGSGGRGVYALLVFFVGQPGANAVHLGFRGRGDVGI